MEAQDTCRRKAGDAEGCGVGVGVGLIVLDPGWRDEVLDPAAQSLMYPNWLGSLY